jgi:preprotein translocase subunit SecD
MNRRYINLAIILILLIVVVYVDTGATIPFLNRGLPTVLGLDLRGGTQALLEVDLPESTDVTASQLSDARQILSNRINGLGVSENTVQVAGNRRMVVQIPGLTDPQQVINVIKNTGQLEFVDMADTPGAVGSTIKTDLGATGSSTGAATVAPTAAPTTGAGTPTATSTPEKVWHTVMTGSQLESVNVTTDQLGNPEISFILKSEGATTFAQFTGANVGKYLAIVLDKKIISAPTINSQIPSGQGVIQGKFSVQEANDLAVQMRYGSLPVPLKVIQSQVIGPSLGEDSLAKSILAGIIGFSVVTLFMILYYRVPGVVAMLSIAVYAAIAYAIYKAIPVTLTLPGIVGFLLSAGSAMDANILIFERMKEELRAGRTLANSIELGWRRAWPSIRDSNLATLFTTFILIWFGSTYGATVVLGFAVTLLIGIIISLFCAIFVTRTLLTLTIDLITKPTERLAWFGL